MISLNEISRLAYLDKIKNIMTLYQRLEDVDFSQDDYSSFLEEDGQNTGDIVFQRNRIDYNIMTYNHLMLFSRYLINNHLLSQDSTDILVFGERISSRDATYVEVSTLPVNINTILKYSPTIFSNYEVSSRLEWFINAQGSTTKVPMFNKYKPEKYAEVLKDMYLTIEKEYIDIFRKYDTTIPEVKSSIENFYVLQYGYLPIGFDLQQYKQLITK